MDNTLLENYIVVVQDYNIDDVSYVQASNPREAASYADLNQTSSMGRVFVFPIDKDTPVNFRLDSQSVPSNNVFYKDELITIEEAEFTGDTVLMYDFLSMTREQFLKEHPLVHHEEYECTMREFINNRPSILAQLMRDAENMYIEELNERDTYKDLPFTSKDLKNTVVTFANIRISLQEYEEFCELCNSMGC